MSFNREIIAKEMKLVNEEYLEYLRSNKDLEKSVENFHQYLKNSSAKYHGRAIDSLLAPKIYTKDAVSYLSQMVQEFYEILRKTHHYYRTSKEFRDFFKFSKEMNELVMLEAKYDCFLPIARFDIFLNELTLDFKFCEINTDGTSAMNEMREVGNAIKYMPEYKKFASNHIVKDFELFDSWAKAFLEIYQTYPKKVNVPNVAIVDFFEFASSMQEFEFFRQSFLRAGCACEIVDIRNLQYQDGVLVSDQGYRVDAIYRRAVTSDILEKQEEISGFMKGLKEDAVCVIGEMSTQISHHKILFEVLHRKDMKKYFTEQEIAYIKEHVPYSADLSEIDDLTPFIEEKDKWFLKPQNSYGARDAFAGNNHTKEEWEELLKKYHKENFLIQEFSEPFRTPNFHAEDQELKIREFYNLTGMYVYNGEFTGIYARASKMNIISDNKKYDEAVVPAIWCTSNL